MTDIQFMAIIATIAIWGGLNLVVLGRIERLIRSMGRDG